MGSRIGKVRRKLSEGPKPSLHKTDLQVPLEFDSTEKADDLWMLQEELATARADLESERLRYREVFDLNPDAHLVTNKIGVISEANNAASLLLGVPSRYVIGKPLAISVTIEDRVLLREVVTRMARIDQTELTLRLIPRGAPMRDAHVKAAAIRPEVGGPLTGIRWIIRDITSSRQVQEEIAGSREKLRELTSELSLAEERVRREVAIGIHDRISQPLALAKILLGQVKVHAPAHQSHFFDELKILLQQAIDESRTLTFELSPPILYELGLPAAIEWLAEQMQRRHGVRIRLVKGGYQGLIPEDLRVLLFQAVRELLTNVIKHARAKRVTLSVSTENGSIQVLVNDDGKGFNPAQSVRPLHDSGFGLFSIRTRVERVGGQFLVESGPGTGTRVTVIVPIPAEILDKAVEQSSRDHEQVGVVRGLEK